MSALLGSGSGIKAGTVEAFAGEIPAGWLECNGAAISRAAYAKLFLAIGETYGAGDGAATFNLPDLRGEFIRGLDAGRGVDAGRILGTAQLDQMQKITGNVGGIRGNSANSGVGAMLGAFNGSGSLTASGASGGAQTSGSIPFNSENSSGARAGDETRSRNVAMRYGIKY